MMLLFMAQGNFILEVCGMKDYLQVSKLQK